MKKLLFVLALLAPALGRSQPETVTRRFLLEMRNDGRHAAYAVVDASTTKDGEKYLQWALTVTYYLGGGRRGVELVTRHYGSSVGNRAGDDTLALELRPNSVLLSLPTPDGGHAIPLLGGLLGGQWSLSGSAAFGAGDAGQGRGKARGRQERWSAASVHRIRLDGIDLRG